MSAAELALLAAGALAIGWFLGRSPARRLALQAERKAWQAEKHVEALAATLAESQALLEALGAAVSDAVLVLDAEERVRWATAAARAQFGIPEGEASTVMTIVRSVELHDMLRDTEPGQAESQTLRIRERIYRAGVLRRAEGGAVVALRDDTELERLARARRDLVANISHDLRTPLTSIGLLAETLLTEAFNDPARREAVIGQIRGQLDTLEALAEGMVELNQLESGRAILRLQQMRLEELARTALEGMAPQLADGGIEATVEVPPDLEVLADGPHIIRVFVNLLDNARRYSPRGSRIQIGARPAEAPDLVEVWVRDMGTGIAPGDLERIFERFYRGDRARTRRSAGLGLAIARHIILGHGGSIWAENNRDRGATLHFTLRAARG